MQEDIYWTATDECLQHGKEIIKAGEKLPAGLDSKLLESLKERKVIGSKGIKSKNVPTDPENKELSAKLKAAETKNATLAKIVREKSSDLQAALIKAGKLEKEVKELIEADDSAEIKELEKKVKDLEKKLKKAGGKKK